jgi:hypothetical protein
MGECCILLTTIFRGIRRKTSCHYTFGLQSFDIVVGVVGAYYILSANKNRGISPQSTFLLHVWFTII